MKKQFYRNAYTLLLLLLTAGYAAAQPAGSTWTLTFEDTFDGTALNTSKWSTGFGWGAKSDAFDETTRPENVTLASGIMRIKMECVGTAYWSGAINSRNKFYQRYGYWEARIKVPSAIAGLLPAFWMKHNDDKWPPELDIMEVFGSDRRAAFTVHYGAPWPNNQSSGTKWDGGDLSTAWHTFGVEWDENAVKWYVDGVVRRTYARPEADAFLNQWNAYTSGAYMMLNVHAKNADWMGGSLSCSNLPKYMDVDYVRVYKKAATTSGGNLTIRARGVAGGEVMELRVNNTAVKTWTLTTAYQDYTYNVSGANNIKVAFTNDGGSRDVQVDYITAGTATYQAESQATNTGHYTGWSCGQSYSEWLHCNGYIDFGTIDTGSSSAGGNLTIRARGVAGGEVMELRVNNTAVQTWTLTTAYQNYSRSVSGANNIKVAFTNDGGSRDVQVDYITAGTATYQAESQATNTGHYTGWSCGQSYSEWLHCNGYIDFGTISTGARVAADGVMGGQRELDFSVYPNPAIGKLTLNLNARQAQKADVRLVNVFGQPVITRQVYLVEGNNSVRLLTEKISPGVYFIYVVRDGSEQVQRVVFNNR